MEFSQKRSFKPAISCVIDQDVTTVPAKHRQERGSLNWPKFMLQWVFFKTNIFLIYLYFTIYLLIDNHCETAIIDLWKSLANVRFVWCSCRVSTCFVKNCGMEQKGLENVSEKRDTINKVTLLVTKVWIDWQMNSSFHAMHETGKVDIFVLLKCDDR